LLKHVERAEDQVEHNSLPTWMGNVVQEFKQNVTVVDAKIEDRSQFLRENLRSWIQFEEIVDQINGHLDNVEGENLVLKGNEAYKYDSLHAVEQQMKQLLGHKENMVC